MIMIVNLIPYILAIMIFYDFSNHLLELIFGREKAFNNNLLAKFVAEI